MNVSFTPSSLMGDRLGVYGWPCRRTHGFLSGSKPAAVAATLRPTVFSAAHSVQHLVYLLPRGPAGRGEEPASRADRSAESSVRKPVGRAVHRYRWVTRIACRFALMRDVLGSGSMSGDGSGECIVGYNYGCTEVGNIATNGRLDQRFRVGGPASRATSSST